MEHKINNIMTVIGHIEHHLNEKMTLDSIAAAVGYSKFHLHRMFLDTVGISIHSYIQRRQLTEAAKLLVFSDCPILDIALISGYESQQSFTAAFKQMYKKSPKEYRDDEEFYPLQLRFHLELSAAGDLSPAVLKSQITFAELSDIPIWMDLVTQIIDGFPHLNEAEYKETLREYILSRRALILKDGPTAAAVMMINYDTGSIDFFGIHPLYRKHGIAGLFLEKAAYELLPDTDLSITTYREGDKADTGYRKAYQELGFAEAELMTEFGYPTQKFIWSRNTSLPGR